VQPEDAHAQLVTHVTSLAHGPELTATRSWMLRSGWAKAHTPPSSVPASSSPRSVKRQSRRPLLPAALARTCATSERWGSTACAAGFLVFADAIGLSPPQPETIGPPWSAYRQQPGTRAPAKSPTRKGSGPGTVRLNSGMAVKHHGVPHGSRGKGRTNNRFALAPGSRWPPAHQMRCDRPFPAMLGYHATGITRAARPPRPTVVRTEPASTSRSGLGWGGPDETRAQAPPSGKPPMGNPAPRAEWRHDATFHCCQRTKSKLCPARPERRAQGPVKPVVHPIQPRWRSHSSENQSFRRRPRSRRVRCNG